MLYDLGDQEQSPGGQGNQILGADDRKEATEKPKCPQICRGNF